MKIVCVTSFESVGCTFIDWSLHFLSNQSSFYCYNKLSSVPLSTDPINTLNAHGHKKNHPTGSIETQEYINNFHLQSSVDFCSLYPFPIRYKNIIEKLNLNINDIKVDSVWRNVQQHVVDDYQTMFFNCCSQGIKTIFVNADPNLKLYSLATRQQERFTFSNNKPQDLNELTAEIQDTFFSNSIDTWNKTNLTDIWDVRERMALDTRPLDYRSKLLKLDLSQPHLWINSSELWNNGCNAIKKIMDFAELKINTSRWAEWIPIYQKWHTIQQKNLSFVYQFDHIINSIVNNFYYELDDLTFEQEVAIQHALIYQHNLNLKTWQLIKFPSNTQDINKLLEPNIHLIKNF